jgi:hypothetical protein
MPIFAIKRAADKEPLLLIDAADEAQATEHVNSLDMIGVLRANGYRNAVGGYVAVPATVPQVARWTVGNLASLSGPGRHAPQRHNEAPAYVHFIAPVDFRPSEQDATKLPRHQKLGDDGA